MIKYIIEVKRRFIEQRLKKIGSELENKLEIGGERDLEEIFSKVIAIVLGSIMLFIVPIRLMNQRQQNINQTYVLTEAMCMVDSVCNKGIIYEDTYLELLNKTEKTGEILKLELEHYSGESGNYTKQILSELEENGDYKMKRGDLFKIKIFDNNNNILAFYGGYIKDEDY